MEEDHSCLSNFQRQLAEVEALRSIYSQEGEFQLTSPQETALQFLQDLGDASEMEPLNISFTIKLQEAQALGQPISVAFCFPPSYPKACAATVSVDCGSINRQWHENFNIRARSVAESLVGEEAAFQVLQKIQEIALELQESEKSKVSIFLTADPKTHNAIPSLKRKLMWFHHIKFTGKRKAIKDWGEELNLGGYCKPGFPGILIFEGEGHNVIQYVKRIQRLRWQAVSVRAEEEEFGSVGQSLNDLRHFPLGIKEVGENGMSELAAICQEACLQHLFLSALKISR